MRRYGRRSDKQKVAEAFHVNSDLTGLSMPPDDYMAPTTFSRLSFENRNVTTCDAQSNEV